MAVVFMDGMDTYTATADALARYPGANTGITLSTTAGRFGGGCIAPGQTFPYLQVSFASTASAMICGGCFWLANNQNGTVLMSFYNSVISSTIPELTVYLDSVYTLRLYRGTSNGTLIASATTALPVTLWCHIEVKPVCADSGGSVEVRVNGTVVINYSGDTKFSSTGSAALDRVLYGGYTNTGGYWDDIYVLDTTGSFANDFIGDCRINTLAPTSDSAVQFTKSTGASNFSCVDEGRMNSDTDYVESSTVGHIDKYGYGDLAASVTTVYAVQALTWLKKTDAGTRTLRNLIYSGASTSTGTTTGLLTTYAPIAHVAPLNPSGSIQWTPTTVNAALAGFEIIA